MEGWRAYHCCLGRYWGLDGEAEETVELLGTESVWCLGLIELIELSFFTGGVAVRCCG